VIVVIERSPSIQGSPNKASPTTHPKQQIPRQKSGKSSKSKFSQTQQGHFSGDRAAAASRLFRPLGEARLPADAVMHAASRSTNKQLHIARVAHGACGDTGRKSN
jgi:hypothetical protein